MPALNYDRLFDACRELFGPDIETCPAFLDYLQPSGVKSAFRRKAKETHPDVFAGSSAQFQDLQAAHFCRAKSAYEMLSMFISQREQEERPRATRCSSTPPRYEPPPANVPRGEEGLPAMPQRALQLGRYLYYRRAITFRELLQAITWQRTSRSSLGMIAREWGWMTAADVFAVMTAKLPGRFGEKAVRLGMLNAQRVKMILLEQKIRHQRIGQYFVQSRMLTPQELDFFLKELRAHNSRFGSF
jgi:hypothetical protein